MTSNAGCTGVFHVGYGVRMDFSVQVGRCASLKVRDAVSALCIPKWSMGCMKLHGVYCGMCW